MNIDTALLAILLAVIVLLFWTDRASRDDALPTILATPTPSPQIIVVAADRGYPSRSWGAGSMYGPRRTYTPRRGPRRGPRALHP